MFITTNSCRICLNQKSDSLLPLFGVLDEQRLHELIKYCCGIDIIKHNYLPEFICHECLSQLIEAEKIKKKCIESDNHLKNMILHINANEEQLISLEEKIHIHQETNTKLPETNEYSPKTTTKSYNCDVCGKTLKYKYKLERHLNYHLKIAAKDKGAPVTGYECNFCNKKLPTKVTLERHLKRLHVPEDDDESPIKCNLCSPFLYFESAKSLDFHLKMTHYHVKRYSCEKCNRNFSRKIRYMRHLRHCLNFKIAKENNQLRDNQNLGKLDDNPASRIFFMCFKCKYAFATRPELMKHITAGCSPDNLNEFY